MYSKIEGKHPLYKIKKNDKVINILKTLNSVPIEKLEEIEQIIKERIK